MTDFRNLIQRLTDELDAAASNLYFDDYAPDIKSVLADARAYLAQPEPAPSCVACEGRPSPGNSPCHVCGQSAQPEPQWLTDEKWFADFAAWLAREMPAGTVIANPLWWAPRIARAVLARWGRPAIEPQQEADLD